MKTGKKLLWAVNLKENNKPSSMSVMNVANMSGSEIIILHILDKKIEGSPIQSMVEHSVLLELDQMASALEDNGACGIQTRIEYGNALETLLEVAKDEKVNSIFINQKGGP